MRIPETFHNLRQDVRYAVRGFHRSPQFTIAVIVMLALGIGANTAIFSFVDRLLLRQLPYPQSDRLVMMYESFPRTPRGTVSISNWLDWQRSNQSFESLAAWNGITETFAGDGNPELVTGQLVSAEFLPTLKVTPLLGRAFTLEDDQPGAAPVIILSHGLWMRRFNADPGIVGKKIELNATPREVVGVMPQGFYFLDPAAEYWTPYQLNRSQNARLARTIPSILARLKPGITAAAAQAEMRTIAARLEQLYAENKNASATVVPLREVLTDAVRPSLIVLLTAVTALLGIACFNVAGLMLARSASRRREIAVRISLGARKSAILRQLIVESLLLALAGGAAGFLIALWGISALLGLSPRNLIRVPSIPIDGWMLLYTLGLSILSGFTFGLAPAISASRRSLAQNLQSAGRSITKSARVRQGLLVAQVTLTVILLCGSGLLVRSFTALNSVPTGLDAGSVLTMQINMPGARYNRDQQIDFVTNVIRRLEALPGVQSAGATRSLPVIGPTAGTPLEFEGTTYADGEDRPAARIRMATPGYFKTVGIPIVRGREFTWEDQRPNTGPTFIVNQSFVNAFLKGRDPLSAAMKVYMTRDNPFGPIVGVAADVLEGSLRGGATPTLYYNHRQLTYSGMTLFVRTDRPAAMSHEAVQVIRDLDPNLAVTQVRPLTDALSQSIARERMNAIVSAAFAITGLILAAFGLYGLLTFLVTERTREIGIRMALGAEAGSVLRLVMGRGLQLVVCGGAAGMALGFTLSRFIQALLFGVQSHDPATFAAAGILLLSVTAIAAFVPARRATRVDPVVALREE